ncbi:MAG: hypothetical protein K2H18_06210 [Muribaculaceae bacterium]|nr:hypothetical protein [Muribaculaceae bacterium]
MKKVLLFGLGVTALLPVIADVAAPERLKEFYSRKISADGSVIYSEMMEEVQMYRLADKEIVSIGNFMVGNGNCVTKDGSIIVGGTEMDTPVMVVNGEEKSFPELVEKFALVSFHGITGDATRICGLVTNLEGEGTETMYVPAYWDLNSDGTVGETQYLPYPAKDWQGLDVQHCSAVWISDDGKTILGQVIDWSGMDIYPIIYKQDDKGEWSYSLPTLSLINPNKLPLPVYPGDFDGGDPPYYENYMTAEEKTAYENAVNDYYNGNSDTYPEAEDFMTAEQAAKYKKDCEEYDAKASVYNEKLEAYLDDKARIEEESVFFEENSLTMKADGTMMGMLAEKTVENDDPMAWIPFKEIKTTYLLDPETSALTKVESPGEDINPAPSLILSDGTVIANSPAGSIEGAYVLAPGANEYVDFTTYFATKNAAGAEWLKENFTHEMVVGYDSEEETEIFEKKIMTGNVVVADDWSVVSGGVEAYMYPDPEDYDLSFESYIIQKDMSGVSSVAADVNLVDRKYYDINGLEIMKPEQGIYVERSVYSDGTVVTSKKVFK